VVEKQAGWNRGCAFCIRPGDIRDGCFFIRSLKNRKEKGPMKIIYNDGHVAECPEEEELEVLRHSAAHIMAQAVKRLYPDAHFAYGPATEKGFHYDIDLGDVRLTDEDLPAIEKEMQKIVKENLPFKVYPLPRAEAVQLMQDRG